MLSRMSILNKLKYFFLAIALTIVVIPTSPVLAQKDGGGSGFGGENPTGFCDQFPELAYTDMNIWVTYDTPSGPGNQGASGSNGNGNNGGLTVQYPDEVWNLVVHMSGSAGPGEAFGNVRSTVQVDGATVFDQTDYGGFGGPAYSDYTYTVSTLSTSGFALWVNVRSEACSNVTDQSWYVYVNSNPVGFTCSVTESSTTLDQGGSHVFTLNTTAQGGFNSSVNFSASVSPSGGTSPQVTMSGGNPHTPPGTATAIAFAPSGTTAQTYTVTFTGTGGGKTASCVTQLVVNPPGPNFALVLTPVTYSTVPSCPVSGTCAFPNGAIIQDDLVYQLFVDCTGGFSGPVTSLIASVSYQGATITFNNGSTILPSLACGATTPVTVHTSGVQSADASTPQNVILRNILVTGQGSI